MTGLTAAADALAAYRLTRLVTADKITAPLRDNVVAWLYAREGRGVAIMAGSSWSEFAMADDEAPKLATLLTCRWCTGMYAAAGVVVARRLTPRAWAPVAEALALAAAAALLARLEE